MPEGTRGMNDEARITNDERSSNAQITKGRQNTFFLSFGFLTFIRASTFVLRHFLVISILHDEPVHGRFHVKS